MIHVSLASCEQGEADADALQAAGVAIKRHQGAGLIHGYFSWGEASEAAQIEAQRARRFQGHARTGCVKAHPPETGSELRIAPELTPSIVLSGHDQTLNLA
jgi:hypothetical protein